MEDYGLQTQYEDNIYETPIGVSLPNKRTKTTKGGKNVCQKKTVVALVVISIILGVAVITLAVMMLSIKNNIDQLQTISLQTDTKLRELNVSLQSTTIAFFATVKNTITNLGDSQNIPFESVRTNIGEGYHPKTSMFSCPRSGVYVFFWTIICFPNKHVETQIVKDGTWLALSYCRSVASNRFDTGSGSVVVRLQRGVKVWIQVDGDDYTGSGDMIFRAASSFSGFSILLD